MGYINTTPSKTAFDVLDVSLLSKINLINLFASYRGKPRLFEIEAIAGIDRKSTRLNSSHKHRSRMPSSA